MDFIFLIASSIMILTCLYFIISPFFTGKEGKLTEANTGEDTFTLEAIYGAVNELEMDYLMKKISEADYTSLKEQYQLLAAGMMKQGQTKKKQSNTKRGSDKVELEILAELQKLRKQKGR
ncbi:hypothetical protein [Robertmurraya andreesenii]|uniref:C-type cytochrome biogenesis protein CcmI n=1 Tax=Anoxybacillus andreesenii TaxID=1325932 RepID=A0ABT9UZI3_9BACL|nr:hypothetical protein [Robertmurraya andreesenii]MDQ0154105.1 hypothetical protein [Robertmurraya andreesenii]